MDLRPVMVSRWILASCLLAAGLVGPGAQAGTDAPYDIVDVEKTLAFGYGAIIDRHLERTNAAGVALEAMRGLSHLDPAVTVTRLDNKVLLSVDDRQAGEYSAPAESEVEAWAHLTMAVAIDARALSPAIKEASGDQVLQAVFDATLAKLDRFSRYAAPKDAADHRASRDGISGIGLNVEMERDTARVIEVIAATPAQEAGVAIGDRITRIGGESLTGLDNDSLAHRLSGPVDSEIGLTIRPQDGQERALILRRKLILPSTVTTVAHDGVAAFKVSGFNQRTALSLTNELEAARAKLGADLKGVVLDLRGNPGGLLEQAVEIADLFITSGPIVSTKGRHPLASRSYQAQAGDIGEDLPLVVLVDGKTASAAEILAGALQDAGRAVVIGTNSYGKGTVQTVIHLPNDGEMTLTWSRFLTPSGYALHELGVLPTLCTADERSRPDRLIASVIDSPPPAIASLNLARWRAAPLNDAELRLRLRATCPCAKQGELALDMSLAEKLLNDRPTYARALALSAPPTAASTATTKPNSAQAGLSAQAPR